MVLDPLKSIMFHICHITQGSFRLLQSPHLMNEIVWVCNQELPSTIYHQIMFILFTKHGYTLCSYLSSIKTRTYDTVYVDLYLHEIPEMRKREWSMEIIVTDSVFVCRICQSTVQESRHDIAAYSQLFNLFLIWC